MKPTCGETEERKEGDSNPFRGYIVVLELLLVINGAVRRTCRSVRNWVEKTQEGRRAEGYALMTEIDLGTSVPLHWACLYIVSSLKPQLCSARHQSRNRAVL